MEAQVLLGRQVHVERLVLEDETDVPPHVESIALHVDVRPRVAVPSVGSTSVQSILMVVDFPAPLGPRKPKISPGATSNEMPSTAVNDP